MTQETVITDGQGLFAGLLQKFIDGAMGAAGSDCFNLIWDALNGDGDNPDAAALEELSNNINNLATSVNGIPAECVFLTDYNKAKHQLIDMQSYLPNINQAQWYSVVEFLNRGASDNGSDYFSLMAAIMDDAYGFSLNTCFQPNNHPYSQSYGSGVNTEAYALDQNWIGNGNRMLLEDYINNHISLALSLASMSAALAQTANLCYQWLVKANNQNLFAGWQYANVVTGILNNTQIAADLNNPNSSTFFPTVIYPYLKFAPLTLCGNAYIIYLQLTKTTITSGGLHTTLLSGNTVNGASQYMTVSTSQSNNVVSGNGNASSAATEFVTSGGSDFVLSLYNFGNTDSMVNIAAPGSGFLGIVEVYVGGASAPWELLEVFNYGFNDQLCCWNIFVTKPSWITNGQPVYVFQNAGNQAGNEGNGQFMCLTQSGGTVFPDFTSTYATHTCDWILSPTNYNQTIMNLYYNQVTNM